MNKQDKIDYLKQFEKEEQIHSLLEELLPEMGYKDVKVTHERGNYPENGKDLICSKFDDIEDKKDWLAFVVKKGVIAGTSTKIAEVESQTKDCFEYEYDNVVVGKRIKINKVKVVTNERFSNGAETKILKKNSFDKANIDFWDGERLVKHIDKYYPQYWIKGSKQYKKYIEKLNDFIHTDSISRSLGVQNKKLQQLIDQAIELRLFEPILNEDGSFTRKSYSSNSIIKIPDNSIIIGQPGSGKTTLFKVLAKEIIEQNSLRNDSELYPIIISFKDINDSNFIVEDAIKRHLDSDLFNEIGVNHELLLKEQNFILFIDALDEVGKIELKEKALKAIKVFKKKYENVKLYCSSRPSDYLLENCQALGFKYLEVDELNRRQVEQFINLYFNDDFVKCKRLLKSLKESGILNKLPKTPLTLSLISIIFDERELEIPATISDLYSMFVDLLIGKNQIKESHELIEIGIKNRVLASLAKELHTNYKQSYDYQKTLDFIKKYSEERGQGFHAEDLLKNLINNSGLLFINDKKEVAFKHLSFQEYFTAYEFFHHRPTERDFFVTNFNKVWWQNVAIFYAGMSKDSPTLLNEILDSSMPRTFEEAIINIAGIGNLLQALYNTPSETRIKGISRSAKNTVVALNKVLSSSDKKYAFWKHFSKYGLMTVLAGWYRHNHSSITLVQPVKSLFEKVFTSGKELKTEEEKFNRDFGLLVLAATVSNTQFNEFEPLLKLVQNRNSSDLSLTALIDMHIRDEEKILKRDGREDDVLKKISNKNKQYVSRLGKFADKVNIPLNKSGQKEKSQKRLPKKRAD